MKLQHFLPVILFFLLLLDSPGVIGMISNRKECHRAGGVCKDAKCRSPYRKTIGDCIQWSRCCKM